MTPDRRDEDWFGLGCKSQVKRLLRAPQQRGWVSIDRRAKGFKDWTAR